MDGKGNKTWTKISVSGKEVVHLSGRKRRAEKKARLIACSGVGDRLLSMPSLKESTDMNVIGEAWKGREARAMPIHNLMTSKKAKQMRLRGMMTMRRSMDLLCRLVVHV